MWVVVSHKRILPHITDLLVRFRLRLGFATSPRSDPGDAGKSVLGIAGDGDDRGGDGDSPLADDEGENENGCSSSSGDSIDEGPG